MHHLADVAPAVAARAAHDVDRVLVPLGGDEPDLGAALLDDGIRADRRAVREKRDVAAEVVEREAERLRAGAERVEHAAREIGRRRRHFGGEELPRTIDNRAVGKGAADVDADQVAHGKPQMLTQEKWGQINISAPPGEAAAAKLCERW